METHNGWSELIIAQLVANNVRHFCIAPGSRSTPLVAAADAHPLVQTHVHFDERGLAFFALGIAKKRKEPVAIIVTSGSAAANVHPAVMEAFHEDLPLIVLSADRPYEMQHAGENQTTIQHALFGAHVHLSLTLPPPTPEYPPKLLASQIAHALQKTKSGPIHLNCMFREPFFSEKPTAHNLHTRFESRALLPNEAATSLSLILNRHKHGIILSSGNCPHLEEISAKLEWPLITDISSSCRGTGAEVPFADIHCDQYPFTEVTCVLQVGDRFVSKKLLNTLPCVDWIHLTSSQEHRNPRGRITHTAHGDLSHTLPRIASKLSQSKNSAWLDAWRQKSTLDTSNLTEPAIFALLSKNVSWLKGIFFGNSLTVRNATNFFYPNQHVPTFVNRGVSGIDGNIGCIAGIATVSDGPFLAVIGDQTFLHDTSSLPLLSTLPVLLIVLNNGGGNIFSHLPIAKKKALHETYFLNPHSHNLTAIAESFGFNATRTDSLSSTIDAIDSFATNPEATIIEVTLAQNTTLAHEHTLLSRISR